MSKKPDPAETSPEPASPPASMRPGDDLLTTRELMDYLHISRTKVWEMVNKKGLPAFKLGGDYRYRRAEVDAWLEKFRVPDDSPKDK
jgi:excisionase family DNA binding protein